MNETQQEIWALKTTVEEGSELLAEAYWALAGLAGEPLRPCVDTCQGHFGDKGRALYSKGLEAYRKLMGWPGPTPPPPWITCSMCGRDYSSHHAACLFCGWDSTFFGERDDD